jgi:hypothetical protein
VLRQTEGGAQVGTRCWETGGFTAMHVRQAQLFKRLHCCDDFSSDDIIDNFSYMPPHSLRKVPKPRLDISMTCTGEHRPRDPIQ